MLGYPLGTDKKWETNYLLSRLITGIHYEFCRVYKKALK
jgi:hypothetical protein